ncbi:MAG TPA: peptide chain release factor N(5)-glutamine methyltransferase [Acetobacteraceae bacterium]|nr:peptide chain release factor N(5)-glutamine methyltransferase [Acetobacteraceae bacterium]
MTEVAGATAAPTIAEALRSGAQVLAGAGVDSPRLESRLLLAHALGRSAEDLIRDLSATAPPSNFVTLITRRASHEPLAFILGWREFWSLRFRVSNATLIPRPDSETVVEAALAACPDVQAPIRVLDLGTGTGCLLLAVLRERPNAFGVGIDRFEAAVQLALSNAHDLGLAGRSVFFCADWAEPIDSRFDLVLSNPPYIATAELAGLMPEVALHEPPTALDGGACGLTAYRAIIAALPRLLAPSGVAVLELGEGQFDAVGKIAAAAGFRVDARRDLAGITRVIILHTSP